MRTATLLFASVALLLSFPAPAQSAAAPESSIRLVHRVEPKWPREALREGISGIVTARLTIDARGNVTDVVVVRAVPRRIFEKSVVEALSQWRYNEGAPGRSTDSEIAFELKR